MSKRTKPPLSLVSPPKSPEVIPFGPETLGKFASLRDRQATLNTESAALAQAELKAAGVPDGTPYAAIVANGIIVGLRRLTPQEIAQAQQGQPRA